MTAEYKHFTKKTITVSFPHYTVLHDGGNEKVYRVQRVTDSVEYAPDQYLTKAQVVELCEARDWKVLIVGVQE